MIEPINHKLRQTEELYIIHDTRASVRILAKMINEIVKKINEIIEQLNNKTTAGGK